MKIFRATANEDDVLFEKYVSENLNSDYSIVSENWNIYVRFLESWDICQVAIDLLQLTPR